MNSTLQCDVSIKRPTIPWEIRRHIKASSLNFHSRRKACWTCSCFSSCNSSLLRYAFIYCSPILALTNRPSEYQQTMRETFYRQNIRKAFRLMHNKHHPALRCWELPNAAVSVSTFPPSQNSTIKIIFYFIEHHPARQRRKLRNPKMLFRRHNLLERYYSSACRASAWNSICYARKFHHARRCSALRSGTLIPIRKITNIKILFLSKHKHS